MYCSKCGAKIMEGTLFCTQCGTSLQNNPPTKEKMYDNTVHMSQWNFTAPGQAAEKTANMNSGFYGAQSVHNAGQGPNQYKQPSSQYQPQPNSYGMGNSTFNNYHIPIRNYDPSKDYTPISMWGYFGYQLLFAIPIIGQILVLIFAFGGTKNINLRNYARSTFCLFIILAVVALLITLIVVSASV